MECPSSTYPAHDLQKSVCSLCHYTCASCSGPSSTECTTCHSDASFLSSYGGDDECVLKSLEWTSQSTKWFYRMTILFGVNLMFLTTGVVYLCLSRILKKRYPHDGSVQSYDYNKLAASASDESSKDKCLLRPNNCLSDSD